MGDDARPARATVEPRDCNESEQALRSDGGSLQRLRQIVTAAVSQVTRSSVASSAMPSDVRRHFGQIGEDLALAHLQRLGYDLVARNHRTRYGEIDLVAFDDRRLVFVEVKARRGGEGRPLEKVDGRKQGQVRSMARAFLAETPDRPRRPEVRFDAIGVIVDGAGRLVELEHLEGAF
jgi:putative endonuclease